MNRLILALAMLLGAAVAVHAQALKLDIRNGLVTLEATNVPARLILAEWARIGGTRVVGGDKITGAPLTLKLVGMSERQALGIILRNVAGFMAAPRLASAAPGASTYDRILILPTSSVPPQAAAAGGRTTAPGGAAINGINGPAAARRLPPRPPNLTPSPADDTDDHEQPPADEDAADTGLPQQPVFTFPSPPGPGAVVNVPITQGGMPAFRPGQPGPAPMITLQPNQNGQPTIYNFVPTTDSTASPPRQTTTFGAVGAPAPGMVQQPTPAPGQKPPKQQ